MNRLKELRQKNNLTLKELSEQLSKRNVKISADALAKYEREDREPKIDKWNHLAEFYGVSPEYLMGIDSHKPKNRLRELRNKAGLSQNKLVSSLNNYLAKNNIKGITAATFSRWENSISNPTEIMWKYLADYFNVSVPYIRGEIDTERIAKIAKMAFCLLEPSLDVELGEKHLPEKGKKGCIGLLLIALINQLGLNTEDIIKELSLKMEGSDFASMINNDDVEGLTEAGLKLANIYDEI